jgi:hypothetical protein
MQVIELIDMYLNINNNVNQIPNAINPIQGETLINTPPAVETPLPPHFDLASSQLNLFLNSEIKYSNGQQ